MRSTMPLPRSSSRCSTISAWVPGTGVFMTTAPDGVPRALLHNLLHNKVLHAQRVVLVN